MPSVAGGPLARKLAESLRGSGVEGARIALVLGSGLGAFAETLSRARTIPFGELDGMPKSRVPGHAGRFVVGDVRGVRVLIQQGRVHLYEGWSPREVTRSVRALALLGIRVIVFTNAAGGLHEEWKPGTLMRVRDHINMQGQAPLDSAEIGRGTPYDSELGTLLDRASAASKVQLRNGVYAGLLGPSYETPAEIRMLTWMGADAVGMSTVIEASAARASGMRVAAISCITNAAAGIGTDPLTHEDVLRAGRDASERVFALLESAIPEIDRQIAK
jgi:purine-nucleoside phosphorylase